MRPLPRLALLAGALAGAVVTSLASAPAPAQAAVAGSTSIDDVVLYDHCQQVPVRYAVDIPQGTSFWRLEVVLLDPSGATSQGNVVTATTGAEAGTIQVQFCGSETPGTWTVHATGFTQVLPAVQLPFALPDTTFSVRPMTTLTAMAKKPLGDGRYRLTTTVQQQDEQGYERADGIPVRLERRVRGDWQRVRGLSLTTVHGRAATVVTGDATYRAVVRARGNHDASTSKPVHLPGS